MIFPYRSQNDWNETKLTRTRGFRYVVPVTSRYGPPFADLRRGIEKYQAKPAILNELSNIMFTCKHNRVFRRDGEPSRIPDATLKRLRRKGRKLKEFVYERIRPRIPKSS